MYKNEQVLNTAPGMSFLGKYYYSICTAAILLLSLITKMYFILSASLFALTALMLLDRLGKGIVLRELIALHGIFICVVMPIFGYTTYNQSDALASLWLRYMRVPEDVYFELALPAMAGFSLMICWPINSRNVSDQGQMLLHMFESAKKKLNGMQRVSIVIIITGIVMFFLSRFLPGAFQFVATLFFWGSFAGVLYIYFTENIKNKRLLLTLFVIFILANAVQSGMFTVVAYMAITMFSFFFIGKKMAYWKKLAVFIIAVFTLVLLQNIKMAFRTQTWTGSYQGSKGMLFTQILVDKVTNASNFFSEEAMFPIYYRTNQGYNISLVMKRFPAVQSFDYGHNLMLSIAASVVPRLFWPDKPEAGGKFNMQYYAGYTIHNWSTNVGPLGEAYGSFGTTGGIIFMFALGWFVRWSYKRVFVIAQRIPLLIFWLPVLFYQITYSAETDTLQILNAIIKSAFFL